MKIAILGTRGIPNNYGGFEQFAEYISTGLTKKGHEVTVYNPHFHPYKEDTFCGVTIKRCYSPEHLIGASANFLYDYLCLKDALKHNFDIIYEAGYHSNAPSYSLLKNKRHPILITNMDGLEWKRSKWNKITCILIKYLEKLAVKKTHYMIADNIGIQMYYKDKYKVDPFFIAYGADHVDDFLESDLSQFNVTAHKYFLLISRLEPENNIEPILDGYISSKSTIPFLVIGNNETKYGLELIQKYANSGIHFAGSVYDKSILDNLRHFSLGYFHGHSVGGTNPSLLEAMASRCLIIAHNNIFNISVMKKGGIYFETASDISKIINNTPLQNLPYRRKFITLNLKEVAKNYSWQGIIDQHENLFIQLINDNKSLK